MGTTGNNDILRHLKLLFSKEDGDILHQSITDFFPAIVYIFDADKKRLQYINESRLTEALGYSLEDLKSWEHDFMKLVFKDDVDLVKQEMEKYYALQNDDDYSYNCRLNHKEGDWRYFR